MHNGTRTIRTATIAVFAIAASLVSGCATVDKASDWIRGRTLPETGEAVILGAPDADDYLDDLYMLTAGDADKQADVYADAESAATLTPGPSTNLRFGLVLATPGHPASNPARAVSVLRGVLDQAELLTQAEIALATVHLASAERIAGVTAEAGRLRSANSRAASAEQRALNQRLAVAEQENQRLRAELEDAQQKLDAITTIERSIREQE
jgi:hypothetical protein